MVNSASQITPDGEVNIEFAVENVKSGDDPVAYYVQSTGPDGNQIMITVFESNRPREALQEGHRYKIENGLGEIWDDGTPGIKTTSSTKIDKVSEPNQENKDGKAGKNNSLNNTPKDAVGNEIYQDELVNITLELQEKYYKEDSKVKFVAWGRDKFGEKVAVTIFEDNQPPTQLKKDEWYEFQNVRSERWDDGTPGILLTARSEVILKETDPELKENTIYKSPIIDKVLNETQTPKERKWYERPFL